MIIAALVGLVPVLPEEDEIYAYAIGVLAGTVVQFLLPLPWLRGRGGRFTFRIDWRDERVRRVLKLMLPVTIALGLINLSLLINSFFGTLVSDEAPAAIDKAFRIYQLPQGLFSIAIATILFPTMSRFAARGARDDLRRTMANGVRQICLLLIPSAVLMAVLAEPITRLVYQRGAFDANATDLTSTALVWWSISLPFQGVSLMFSRTFFSLQRPWATTALAGLNLLVNAVLAAALYGPFGIAGIVIGTVAGTTVMCVAQGWILRGELGGIEGAPAPVRRGADARGGRAARRGVLSHLVGARRPGRALAGRSGRVGARRDQRRLGSSTPPLSGCCGVPEARQIHRLLVSRGRTERLASLARLQRRDRVRGRRVHPHVHDLAVAHPPDPAGRAGHGPAARARARPCRSRGSGRRASRNSRGVRRSSSHTAATSRKYSRRPSWPRYGSVRPAWLAGQGGELDLRVGQGEHALRGHGPRRRRRSP